MGTVWTRWPDDKIEQKRLLDEAQHHADATGQSTYFYHPDWWDGRRYYWKIVEPNRCRGAQF